MTTIEDTGLDPLQRLAPATSELEALFSRHHDRMLRVAYLTCGDAALSEEIVQEAFLKLHRRRNALRDPDAAPAYLRRTVINLCHSSLRRRRLERRVRIEPDATSDPPDGTRLDIVQALRALPSRQRACVVLRYFEDLTDRDTAEALGVTRGTVKSQTHKALKRLGELLGHDHGDVT